MAPAPAERRLSADLATRAVAGLVMALVAGLVIGVGGWLLLAALAAIVILAGGEWVNLTLGRSPRAYALGGIAALPLAVLLAVHLSRQGAPILVLCLLMLLVSFWLIGRVGGWPERGWALFGMIYLGAPAVSLMAVRGLPDGLPLMIWLVVVVVSTDVFAYLVGRSVGGPKLAPRISPGKTRSGLAGGVAAAAIAGAVLASLTGWGTFPAGLCGAVLALVAQAGDLFESAIKRRAGVKDSGTLIPGHGGVLDRLDGFLFAAPVFALAVALDPAGA